MIMRILASSASLSILFLLLLLLELEPSTSSPGTTRPRRAGRLPLDGAWPPCCLRLRGGISKSALLNNYNPEAESLSESRQMEEIERQAQRRAEEAVLGPEDYMDDGIVLEGKPAEKEKRRVRLDPTRRMDVKALVKASEHPDLDPARMGKEIDEDELYRMVQEALDSIEASLEDSDSDSDRFKIPNGFPVPECHQDAFEQYKIKRRFNDGTMQEEEFLRLLQQDAKDRGEVIRPEDEITGPPLQGRLQTPIDDIYPPEDLLAARLMQLIRTHIRNCKEPECEETHGGDDEWFEDRIYRGGMSYWEMLKIWRLWAPEQEAGVQLANGHEPWEERWVDNQWYSDETVKFLSFSSSSSPPPHAHHAHHQRPNAPAPSSSPPSTCLHPFPPCRAIP
jgi:hypothetical protein